MFFQKVNRSNGLQPIPDDFLPEAEQFLPAPLSVALSAGKQPMQLDIILGTTDLEDINSNGKFNNKEKKTIKSMQRCLFFYLFNKSLQFTGDDYDELLNRGGAYVAEYANTKAIPEILRMFSLHRSEALPLVRNLNAAI